MVALKSFKRFNSVMNTSAVITEPVSNLLPNPKEEKQKFSFRENLKPVTSSP